MTTMIRSVPVSVAVPFTATIVAFITPRCIASIVIPLTSLVAIIASASASAARSRTFSMTPVFAVGPAPAFAVIVSAASFQRFLFFFLFLVQRRTFFRHRVVRCGRHHYRVRNGCLVVFVPLWCCCCCRCCRCLHERSSAKALLNGGILRHVPNGDFFSASRTPQKPRRGRIKIDRKQFSDSHVLVQFSPGCSTRRCDGCVPERHRFVDGRRR
mmetsp:Transcript_21346/g.44969  ORF Transcript_21346/g.44969 Transcript_21346/m.44969 type:complete len:213 (-) Transcript_21346:1198-1836(-)